MGICQRKKERWCTLSVLGTVGSGGLPSEPLKCGSPERPPPIVGIGSPPVAEGLRNGLQFLESTIGTIGLTPVASAGPRVQGAERPRNAFHSQRQFPESKF